MLRNDPYALWWWHEVLFLMPPATWRTRGLQGAAPLGFAFDLGGLGRTSPQVLLASKKGAQKSA